MFAGGVALAVCCAGPSGALAFEKEPVTGGMVPVPVPETTAPVEDPESISEPIPQSDLTPEPPAAPAPVVPAAPATSMRAPAPAPAGEDDTTWGVLLRAGYFGLQDQIADSLLRQHPKIAGIAYGAEARYHGEGGGRGVASAGVALDYCTVSADGIWQADEFHAPEAGGGELSLIALTLTGYLNVFPSWRVHPYLGVGIGVGWLDGSYQEGNELVEVSGLIPVLHVPVGLAYELDKRFQFAVEARFLDGISIGGTFQLRL